MTETSKFCEQCGAPLAEGIAFCESCGHAVPRDESTPAAPPPAAAGFGVAPAPGPQAAPTPAVPAPSVSSRGRVSWAPLVIGLVGVLLIVVAIVSSL